jgi:beta-glucosidase
LPIYITENGLADADDRRREKFIKDHLYWLSRAIKEGAVVKGYFYWSFLEIFEMVDMRGYWPKFGLVEIDYKTMERKIRPSAYEYAKICRENSLKI